MAFMAKALEVRFIQSSSSIKKRLYMVQDHCWHDAPLGGAADAERMGAQVVIAKGLPAFILAAPVSTWPVTFTPTGIYLRLVGAIAFPHFLSTSLVYDAVTSKSSGNRGV